eukprot:TRINITY_DN6753_c0_g1_i1.p1 TRINITY_DN6753_c0_g1~~TRINITY_DN6753_c0_g1_i1.p1  ORF type:complete len:128 (+),score=19.09 TRINITY_DN6753_c0_g1_i1:489-872(+)
MVNLTSLSVTGSSNEVTTEISKYCSKLVQLDVCNGDRMIKSLDLLLLGNPNLTTLHLMSTTLEKSTIERASCLPNLTNLNLSWSSLHSLSPLSRLSGMCSTWGHPPPLIPHSPSHRTQSSWTEFHLC